MTVLMNSVMSGLTVVWDREFGFLKEILVAPLGRSGIVLDMEVISKIKPLTDGVDAIRQLFWSLGITAMSSQGGYVISVTIFGHMMTLFKTCWLWRSSVIIMLSAAIWSFSKQE